jgi:hypothetical protein
VPVLGPELRRLWPIARPDSQETDTAPDSVVTPTSRSSRLGKRGCERVKSTPRHPSPVAVLCSATMVIINGASGLFMAKRHPPRTPGFPPPVEGPASSLLWAAEARRDMPKQGKAVRGGLGFAPCCLARNCAALQFAASDVKSTPKGGSCSTKGSSCSSPRHAYLTLSSVLPSIVISSVADRPLFGFACGSVDRFYRFGVRSALAS